LLGYDRVLGKRFGAPGKVLEIFCKHESGNPELSWPSFIAQLYKSMHLCVNQDGTNLNRYM